MRYPKFLQDNERVGLVAPSFGCNIDPYLTRIEAAIKEFEGRGYEIVKGPNTYAGEGLGKSNTPEKCGDELNDFFLNDRSDVILSVGGGETMCEDLEFVDFNAIKNATPKWYMGYSDNTNMVLPLATICDTASIYSICAPSFGLTPWHASIEDAYKLLRGEKLSFTNYDGWDLSAENDEKPALAPYEINQPFNMKAFIGSKRVGEANFSGRLIGGCIDILTILCGTKFDAVTGHNDYFNVDGFIDRYDSDGIVWFLEACELDPMGVKRIMWQLDNAGWFKNAKGFIIGRPMKYDIEAFGLDHEKAVLDTLSKYNVPIILDADLGHLPPMMPMLSGAIADVSASGGELKIDYRLE